MRFVGQLEASLPQGSCFVLMQQPFCLQGYDLREQSPKMHGRHGPQCLLTGICEGEINLQKL